MKLKTIKSLTCQAILASLALTATSAYAIDVTSSTNDGNGPENTLDNSLDTRWSASGDGEYLQYDLGELVNIDSIDIAFFKGDEREANFEVLTSEDALTWVTVYNGTQSTSTTEQFNVALDESIGQFVRVVGYGNSSNSWNSVTEVDINTSDIIVDPVDPVDPDPVDPIENIVYSASTSYESDNGSAHVIDEDLSTRWSADGDGQWVQVDLGSLQTLDAVNVAFYKGDSRQSTFDIAISTDGENFTTVITDQLSSGSSTDLEAFDLDGVTAQYVRYVGYGNTSNSWNSVTELNVTAGTAGTADPVDPDPVDPDPVDPDPVDPDPTLEWDWSVWDLEGGEDDLDPVVGNTMVFNALEAQHVTSNGNGWRHELKIYSDQRVAMTDIYEDFQANIKMDISTGSKIIVAQHHASDTGTIVKLYVADSSESGFDDSVANNGIFDVYVRMAKEDGSGEEKYALGTIESGDDFDFQIINNFGYVTVNASGTNSGTGENWDETFSLQIEDSSESYLKFGNYLQAQDAETREDVDDSDDWAAFYEGAGITESDLTFSNLSYYRDTVAPDDATDPTDPDPVDPDPVDPDPVDPDPVDPDPVDPVDPEPELTCDEMYSCWSDVNTGSVDVTGSSYSATPDSLNDVLDALSSAGGDEIVVTGSGEISLKNYSFDKPVLIRAASIGGTTLETVTINNSNNIAIQGFLFQADNEPSNRVKIVNSTNIKILRNEFDHSGVTTSQTTITTTQASQYIEIAYNTFKDKDVSDAGSYSKITGSYIKTQLDEDETTGALLMTKNLHVHHNNFSNIKHYMQDADTVAGDSDREVIAMGIADSQDEVTNNVVEYNLFDNCDGENEIITVKTSNNVFRYNTFKNSMGSLSFRLGNNNIALGNYFYGEGASENPDDANYQTGGVRTYSDGHMIRDNYMEGLSGTTWRLPILVDHGDNSDTLGGDSHQNSTNVLVYNNTLVDNAGGLTIGGTKYGNKPTDISILDNLVVGGTGELFTEVESSNNTWSGNKAYAYGDATVGKANESLSTMPETPAFFGPLTDSDVGVNAQ